MSDGAAATQLPAAPPAQVAAADQLPSLRAARAVLKQQLKESTKQIRKEVGTCESVLEDTCSIGVLQLIMFPICCQVRRRSRLMKKAAGLSNNDLAWLLARRANGAQ